MIDFDNELSPQGFPYCPLCGQPLGWEDDVMASEIGYLPEDIDSTDDVVVHILCCTGCDHDFEAVQDENGKFCLISQIKLAEEGDEPEVKFNDENYAKFFGEVKKD